MYMTVNINFHWRLENKQRMVEFLLKTRCRFLKVIFPSFTTTTLKNKPQKNLRRETESLQFVFV